MSIYVIKMPTGPEVWVIDDSDSEDKRNTVAGNCNPSQSTASSDVPQNPSQAIAEPSTAVANTNGREQVQTWRDTLAAEAPRAAEPSKSRSDRQQLPKQRYISIRTWSGNMKTKMRTMTRTGGGGRRRGGADRSPVDKRNAA